MKELKFKWSISTIKIFIENTNESKTFELINNKEHLEHLLEDLRHDYKAMFESFGQDDEAVKEYFAAINEIGGWVTNCS